MKTDPLVYWVTCSICVLIMSTGYALFLFSYTGQRPTVKTVALSASCSVISVILPILLDWPVSFKLPVTVLFMLIEMAVVLRVRGFGLLLGLLLFIVSCIVCDLSAGMIMLALAGPERMNAITYYLDPLVVPMNAICAALFWPCGIGAGYLRRKLGRIDRERGWAMARPVIMIAAVIFLLYMATGIGNTDKAGNLHIIMPMLISLLVISVIGGTYVVQDIRFLRQKRQNNRLIHDRSAQDELLRDTRVFRHNIANLLYGLQGTLLTGDFEQVRRYYDHMVETCSIINNENVMALRRIPSIPVGSLLLNKVQAANRDRIPMYVYTDDRLVWRGWKDSDMCEALGVLLDNAMEAAKESASPLVTVEIHNAGNDMELVVRNTCRDVENVGGDADRPGHEGLGLYSLRQTVAGHPGDLFNFFTRGRFVEAHLLLRG